MQFLDEVMGTKVGLQITNISKTYQDSFLGIPRGNTFRALSSVSFQIEEGELLSLLGHNGAGKTTLFNILTGMLDADEGCVKYYDLDLAEDIEDIRSIIGVCPQFDILWDDLTAAEHLYLFGRLKNIPKLLITEIIQASLQSVDLEGECDHFVKTFSGGMKRRLSLAMSVIGDPKVLLLDEPTTGMDPVSRAKVWSTIKEFKRQRVVLLTTHAMEEADVLSDRVAVIVDGQIRCVGSSLNLKNTFGEGYRLTIITAPCNVRDMIHGIKLLIPSVTVFDNSGGSIVFIVHFTQVMELQKFFKLMENCLNPAEHGLDSFVLKLPALILDYGLSHTTLEEVFMKVTAKKETKSFI